MANETALFHSGIDICWSHDGFSPSQYRPTCARNMITSIMCSLTAIFCAMKIRLIVKQRKFAMEWTFLTIFTLGCIKCIVLAIDWIQVRQTYLKLLSTYLSVLMIVAILVYYANRILRGPAKARMMKRWIVPSAGLLVLYFTATFIFALIDRNSDSKECAKTEWFLFSASKLVLVQVFLVAGIVLTRMLGELTFIHAAVRRAHRNALWSIIIAAEMSAVFDFVVDLVFKYKTAPSCEYKFGTINSAGYTAYYFGDRIVAALLTLWVVIYHVGPSFNIVRSKTLGVHTAGDVNRDDDDEDLLDSESMYPVLE